MSPPSDPIGVDALRPSGAAIRESLDNSERPSVLDRRSALGWFGQQAPLFIAGLLALSSLACSATGEPSAETKKFVPRAQHSVTDPGAAPIKEATSLRPHDTLEDVRCETTTRPNPERWRAEAEILLEKDRSAFPEPGRVVFVGSSSIRLWKSLEEDMAPLATLRRGLGGSIVNDSIHYASELIAPYDPSAVVLYAGDNDIAMGLSPSCIMRDVQKFVGRVRELGVTSPIYVVSIKPSPERAALWTQMQEANALLRRLVATDENLHFIDVTTTMLDENGTLKPGLYEPDRLHMNASGYKAWTDRLKPALLRQS